MPGVRIKMGIKDSAPPQAYHRSGLCSIEDRRLYLSVPCHSGRTVRGMADLMEKIAGENSLPVLNLWRSSGIKKEYGNFFVTH